MDGPVKISHSPRLSPSRPTSRRVPFALQTKLKEELDRLESEGIIEKVSKPTEWFTLIIVVEKKDEGLRLCLDAIWPLQIQTTAIWAQLFSRRLPSTNGTGSFRSLRCKCHNRRHRGVRQGRQRT